MTQKLLLITGWGGGTDLLQPLQHALQQMGYLVDLINIFDALDASILEKQIAFASHYDVLIGWSLGGQLATLLASQIEAKFQKQISLVSLASNPCFVAKNDWQSGMNVEKFLYFQRSFTDDAINTLKRFGYLVCQGSPTQKQDLRWLQNHVRPQSISLLNAGLELLARLDLRETLHQFAEPQLHLYAENDALVPNRILSDFSSLKTPKMLIETIPKASHGFPCFMVKETADMIQHFLSLSNK